jgi:hypothetical protein
MGYQLNEAGFNQVARVLTTGIRIDRATDTLPATGDEAIFSIAGGRVWIIDIVGEVTTAIQNQTCNLKLKFNPTATGADTDICANLDIDNDAVGTLYGITGDFSDAMLPGLLALEAPSLLSRPILLSEGAIEIETGATNTGSVAWSVVYVPFDTGASIEAA